MLSQCVAVQGVSRVCVVGGSMLRRAFCAARNAYWQKCSAYVCTGGAVRYAAAGRYAVAVVRGTNAARGDVARHVRSANAVRAARVRGVARYARGKRSLRGMVYVGN